MSVVCQKAYSIVIAPPLCPCLQDTNGDSIVSRSLAYSPDRNEILVVSAVSPIAWTINTLTGLPSARIPGSPTPAGFGYTSAVWVAPESKWFMGGIPSGQPGAAIIYTWDGTTLSAHNPGVGPSFAWLIYALGRLFYKNSTNLFEWNIPGDANVFLHTVPGINSYAGQTIDCASPADLLFGIGDDGARSVIWTYDIGTNTFTVIFTFASGNANHIASCLWDASRGKAWLLHNNTGASGQVGFYLFDLGTTAFTDFTVNPAGIGAPITNPFTHDTVNDLIYYSDSSGSKQNVKFNPVSGTFTSFLASAATTLHGTTHVLLGSNDYFGVECAVPGNGVAVIPVSLYT